MPISYSVDYGLLMRKPRKAVFANEKRMKKNLSIVLRICPCPQAESGWQTGSFIINSHPSLVPPLEMSRCGEANSCWFLELWLEFPLGRGSPCLICLRDDRPLYLFTPQNLSHSVVPSLQNHNFSQAICLSKTINYLSAFKNGPFKAQLTQQTKYDEEHWT